MLLHHPQVACGLVDDVKNDAYAGADKDALADGVLKRELPFYPEALPG